MHANQGRELIEPEGFGPMLSQVLAQAIQPGRRRWAAATFEACQQAPHRQAQPKGAITLTSESPDHRHRGALSLWALLGHPVDSAYIAGRAMIRRYLQKKGPRTSPAVLILMGSSRSTNQKFHGSRRVDVEPVALREGALEEDTYFESIVFVRRDAQRRAVRHLGETAAVDVHLLERQAVGCERLCHEATLPPSPRCSHGQSAPGLGQAPGAHIDRTADEHS